MRQDLVQGLRRANVMAGGVRTSGGGGGMAESPTVRAGVKKTSSSIFENLVATPRDGANRGSSAPPEPQPTLQPQPQPQRTSSPPAMAQLQEASESESEEDENDAGWTAHFRSNSV